VQGIRAEAVVVDRRGFQSERGITEGGLRFQRLGYYLPSDGSSTAYSLFASSASGIVILRMWQYAKLTLAEYQTRHRQSSMQGH